MRFIWISTNILVKYVVGKSDRKGKRMKFIDYLPFFRKRRANQAKSARAFLQRYHNYFQRNSIYLDNIYNKIATDVGAGIDFKHIKVTKTDGKSDTWTEYNSTTSDIMSVLEFSPNALETPTVFWSNVTYKIVEDGIAVVIPTYQSNGQLDELILVDSVIKVTGTTLTIVIKDDPQQLDIDVSSVWMFENPKKNLSAQLKQLTQLIDMNLSVISEKLSNGGQTMKAIVKYNTQVSDGELKAKMEERINNILEVASGGGIGYLDKTEELQELKNNYATATNEEIEFLKGQLYNAFGLNEALFTGNYTEIQYRAYYQSVLMPIIKVIKEEITRKYFTKTARAQGQKLLVQTDLISISSLKDLTEFIAKGSYTALLNANEGRSFIGMAPYDGGDVYQSNRNALTMSEVNQTEQDAQTDQPEGDGNV